MIEEGILSRVSVTEVTENEEFEREMILEEGEWSPNEEHDDITHYSISFQSDI